MHNNISVKVMVTGGAGFIGSHLVDRLFKYAEEIRIIDSLKYGNTSNILRLADSKKITVIKADLADITTEELRKHLEGVDYLYHLAAEKHNQSKDSPERIMKANIEGGYKLFNAAANVGIKKVIFTSSLYSYGRYNLPPMSENDFQTPSTIYGISKLDGENLLRYFYSSFKLPYTVLRLFFDLSCPRQFAGMGYKSVIISNFERILNGKSPVIYGDGEQSLDYIYVDDVVDALLKALSPDYNQEIFNIGSGAAISINELTKLMLEIAKSDKEPIYAPADWAHKTCRTANMSYTNSKFDWNAKIDIKNGLKNVYEWLKNNQAGE